MTRSTELQATLDILEGVQSDIAIDDYGVDDLLISPHPRSSLVHVGRLFLSVGNLSSEDDLRILNNNLGLLTDLANQLHLAVSEELNRRRVERIADEMADRKKD